MLANSFRLDFSIWKVTFSQYGVNLHNCFTFRSVQDRPDSFSKRISNRICLVRLKSSFGAFAVSEVDTHYPITSHCSSSSWCLQLFHNLAGQSWYVGRDRPMSVIGYRLDTVDVEVFLLKLRFREWHWAVRFFTKLTHW